LLLKQVSASVPTATTTPSPTWMPTPTRVPGVLLNGGFESGGFQPGWQDSGELQRAVVSGEQHAGHYVALLGSPNYDSRGGCPLGEAAISQVVDVPLSGHPTLRFWYRLQSYDTLQFDYLYAQVWEWPQGSPQPAPPFLVGRDPAQWQYMVLWSSGWQEAVISLEAYRGRTVNIKIANAMTNEDPPYHGTGWYNTWSYIDDVRMVVAP
jgi:hypothetical protein